jgi:hypothetical protein
MSDTTLAQRQTEYLLFVEVPNPGMKTRAWVVRGLRNMHTLGVIRWYGRWRQFVFYPEPNSLFNKGCLSDINTFLDDAYKDWRRSKEQ